MKILIISLMLVLSLMLYGCGERDAEVKTQAVAPAKELTPEEKFVQTKKDAEAGDAEAQLNLGGMYAKGKGIPEDFAKALGWYQKSAEQGYVLAQTVLGYIYLNGEGVAKDAAKGMEWYQKAAAQGDANAQSTLGNMYSLGTGVPKDIVKAAEWWQKAAVQGDAAAQYNLGGMYYRGEGVPKEAAKAAEWWQKAAVQGDADAQFNLGLMYDKGEGVPRDAVKSVEWLVKAAAQGNADAQGKLGVAYFSGKGIPLDLVRSYAWLNLAAAQDSHAVDVRNSIERLMTPTQVVEGQRLASNWKKGDTLQAAGASVPGNTEGAGALSKQGTGTAFFVSREGQALTNQHVINACKEVRVAGREGLAKVITSDSVNDLALLQFSGKSTEVALLNPDPAKLRQGEDVIVFGYPLNLVLSSGGNLTPGTLSALTGLGNNTNQIQITAPIQPGSSGSPVLDKKGNVIGVVSMKLSDSVAAKATGQIPQNVNFAVNGQTTKAFLDANKVPYKTGGGIFSREKSNADIAEDAQKWTVIVECWK